MSAEPGRRSCRGCGKPLIFARDSESGKIVPLDPVPPTWRLEKDLTGEEVAVRSDALVSHFSTCPNANDFSAGRKRA